MRKIWRLFALFTISFIGTYFFVLFKTSETKELAKVEFNAGDLTNKALLINSAKIMLLGDIMLGRSVMIKSFEKKDTTYPFLKVGDKLRSEDITFANLESSIIKGCPHNEHGYTFCADPTMLEGLNFAGVDIVTIANNHSHNFSEKGFEETKKYLTDEGIKWVGDGNLEIIEKNGINFGFLGFDFITSGPSGKDLDLIKKSKEKVDVLIVAPHWGYEYTDKANKNQQTWAREIISAGGDIISGSHPHWVQNEEKINGKSVYYSLGNFVFDQMWSEETRKGVAIELTFEKTSLIKEEKLKTYIKEWAQPEWVVE